MLQGWQGWWTSGKYRKDEGINQFVWTLNGHIIDRNSPNWGFLKAPYEDTCMWILQISVYNYTWGNYDCTTKTGFVCEVDLRWCIEWDIDNKPDQNCEVVILWYRHLIPAPIDRTSSRTWLYPFPTWINRQTEIKGIKATFSFEVIHASIPIKVDGNRACSRVL